MKKTLLFLLAVVLFAACNNPSEEALALKVSVEEIVCPDTGGDYEIEVTAVNDWTATVKDTWIKLTPTSGSAGKTTVRMKIAVNKESAKTKSTVTFTDGNNEAYILVYRAAKASAYLSVVSETEINAPKDGGEYTIQVESNIRWSASSNVSWAKVGKGVSQNNDNVTVTVSAATAPEETTAIITIAPYGEGKDAGEQTVTITRGGTDATSMLVDPTKIDASSDGGNYTVNVSTTAKWSAWTTWDVDWFKLSNTEGEGDGTFGVTIDPATSVGDLTGIITIEEVRTDSYKPVVTQVTVTRKGKAAASLSVTPMKIDAPSEGGEFPITIKSNYPWTASVIGAKYFSTSISSGDGDATMIISVKPDSEGKEVTGSVTITSSFGGEEARINIRREGVVFSLDKNEIEEAYNFYGDRSTTIKVTSNTDWMVSSSNEKVAIVDKTSGSGNGSFSIRVLPTTDLTDATARITVSSKDGRFSEYVDVTRTGLPATAFKPHSFSVSKSKKVQFSPGNLQYNAFTKTWRFAPRQFIFVGYNAEDQDHVGALYYNGDVYDEKGRKCSNTDISETYNGWVDLFGWGTGARPTKTSQDHLDYKTFIDWSGNKISFAISSTQNITYEANTFRTLTSDEWRYLLDGRKDADKLYGFGCIGEVTGMIILPDGCSLKFTPGYDNTKGSNYSRNSFSFRTIENWNAWEAAGAVFLPAAGYRKGTDVQGVYVLYDNDEGYYWSSTAESSWGAYSVAFNGYGIMALKFCLYDGNICNGYSVRLVRDVK